MWDVIVVGLGAMGAATSLQLAKAGQRVLGLDALHPPHDRGSSHGQTRITRLAIGEGEGYTPLAIRTQALWRELEQATGRSLFTQTGGLVISGPERIGNDHTGDFFGNTLSAAESYGIRHEVLDCKAMRVRYPQFRLAADEYAYFEPEAGYARPETIIEVQLRQAQSYGACLHRGERVVGFEGNDRCVSLRTDAGSYSARHLVLSVGPWLPELLGQTLQRCLRVTRQVLYWFAPEPWAPSFDPRDCPVFIWESQRAAHSLYGFPVVDGADGSVKIASGNYLKSVTPDSIDRKVSDLEIDWMYEQVVAPCLPSLSRNCTRTATCMYTVTPDARFIIDQHPHSPCVTVLSACSGHGFKHSAALGEAVAQKIVQGWSEIDLGGFSLARLGASGSLTTAR